MTEGGRGPTSSSGGGGGKGRGGGRNRGGKRRVNRPNKGSKQISGSQTSSKRSNAGGGGVPGIPAPPQVKITIRNIQNASKFGSVKTVLEDVIEKLMHVCVEKKGNNQYDIEIDRSAARYLIDEEEKVNEYKAKQQAELEQKNAVENEANESDDNKDAVNEATEGTGDAGEAKSTENNGPSAQGKDAQLDVILAPKVDSSLPTILARPLYVIPPRKTRRRGERPGTAYVLLIGPKIEKKDTNIKKPPETNAAPLVDATPRPVTPPNAASSTASLSGKSAASNKPTSYHQQLVKGRLLLSKTLESLTQLAAEDFKTQENFAGCIVERSLNGKSWKIKKGRSDRREGTIEATADYKKWLKSLAEQKEELKARPKPAPGGGALLSSSAGENQENLQPIAALVQHLRTKKQEMKRKKASKKKDDIKKKPKKDSRSGNKRAKRGGGGRGKKSDSAPDGKAKKKKGNPRHRNRPKPGDATPQAVLKPPSANT